MLHLQTHYRLDPCEQFDPPLVHVPHLRFDWDENRFSLYIRYDSPRSHEEGPQLLLQTLHACSNVPHAAMRVFRGDDISLDHRADPDGLANFPPDYRDFILRMHERMDTWATELLNLVRWRHGITGGPLALRSWWGSMRWHDERVDGPILGTYGFLNSQVPVGLVSIGYSARQRIPERHQDVEAVNDLQHQGAAQPLYHDVFREAWNSRESNPRSSVVMAVVAAETAIKTAAVDLCADDAMEWMIENVPSPPIDKMLRDLVTLLPVRCTISSEARSPSKSAIKILRQAIEWRNKLVHGREQGVNADELERILLVVRDILYLLDYYRGHEWAIDHLSQEFAASLHV